MPSRAGSRSTTTAPGSAVVDGVWVGVSEGVSVGSVGVDGAEVAVGEGTGKATIVC